MTSAIPRRRVLLAGKLVDLWEHPELAFGWTDDDIQRFIDRGDWISLFNAVALLAPRPHPAHGS